MKEYRFANYIRRDLRLKNGEWLVVVFDRSSDRALPEDASILADVYYQKYYADWEERDISLFFVDTQRHSHIYLVMSENYYRINFARGVGILKCNQLSRQEAIKVMVAGALALSDYAGPIYQDDMRKLGIREKVTKMLGSGDRIDWDDFLEN